MFVKIHPDLGAPDLALLPIGAYLPRWFMKEQHCDPAEAVQIHRDLGARLSIGMHWGTFPLTDDGFEDPPRELSAALPSANLPATAFITTDPGKAVRL